MLEPRAQHLLKTLIERYVSDGQPVGSRALSRHSGLDLSPATVRNVMADLEEMGFIASPHTSAGRVPTAKGYRFFVDSLMVMKALEQREIDRLEGELVADRPHQLVNTAAGLLSQLTQFAGVVMTPKRRDATFRHLEFLRLAERRVLLILVTSEGDVQNRILHTDRSYSHTQLIEATNFFNQHFAGQPFSTIRSRNLAKPKPNSSAASNAPRNDKGQRAIPLVVAIAVATASISAAKPTASDGSDGRAK